MSTTGKKKTRSRTKTRPSSSMHSAELLSSSGGVPPSGLIGFQNYPVEIIGFTTPAGNQEEQGESTANVRVIVKMLMKKDVVTKLKGIQEFISSCDSDSENPMRFLPFFPRIYNKLALDTNVCVREAIQKALEMYVPKLKKDIVPYLKTFMATWLITQCDPDVTAAFAAQSAFQKSFPEHKQSDAMMYCRSEILSAIKDNLCELTEDTFTESGCLNEDVGKEKYELILICSVRGFKLFISLLSYEDKTKMIQPINDIVNEKRFWAHSRNKVRKVCAAWYELLHIMISEMQEVFQQTKGHLISLVMSSLWKCDSDVIRSVWDCALQVVSTFEYWWHHVNVAEMIFTPLLDFLSHGGYGNASVVYPVLPEFLGQLMALDGVGLNFCMGFFSSMRKSFVQYKLKTSTKECDAVLKGFINCLKYVTNMFVKEFDTESNMRELVSKQLIPLFQSSLKPDGSNIAASSFYPLLGLYLKDLEANDSPSQNLLTLIWENISVEIIGYLNAELEKSEKDVSVLVLLFHCFHQPEKYLSASERKIYFCGESSSTSIDTDYFAVGSSPNLIARVKSRRANNSSLLFKYSAAFCGGLCLELQRNLQACHLELCAEIMSEAICDELLHELLQVLNVPFETGEGATVTFFKSVVLDWMKRACTSCDEASLDWITDIVICFCFSMNIECAAAVLEICSVREHQKIFQRLIMRILGSTESHEEVFRLWLHSHTFSSSFEFMAITLAAQLIHGKLNLDSREISLCSRSLMLCFAEAGSAQPEIPWKPVQRILNYFIHVMSNEDYKNCENQGDYNIIDFICDAAAKLFFQYPLPYLNHKEITVFLFKIFTQSLEWANFNVGECQKEQLQLDYLWKTYVAHVVQDQSDLNENNFLVMAADHLHNLLLKGMSEDKQKRLMEVACIFLGKAEEAYGDLPEDICEPVLIFLIKKILPSLKEWEEARSELQLGTVVPILQSNWFYPFVPDERLPIDPVDIPPLLFLADAVADLLQRICIIVSDKCKPDTQTAYEELLCSQYVPHILWSVCYADALNFFKAQDLEEPDVFSTLRKSFSRLMENCSIFQLVAIISNFLVRDDLTWGVPFERVMQTALLEKETPKDYLNPFYKAFIQYKNNYLTLTQICLKYASKEFVVNFLRCLPPDALVVDCDNPRSEKDFHGILSQLARCLQQHSLQFPPCICRQVTIILENLVRSKRFTKSDNYGDILLVIGFTPIAAAALKDAHDEMSRDLLFLLMKIIGDWFKRCVEISSQILTDSSSLIFMQQTCKLITVMSELNQEWLVDVDDDDGGDDDAIFRKTANNHWENMFDEISKHLVKLFLQFAGKISELEHTSHAVEGLLFALVQALEYLSTEQVLEAVLFVHSQSSSHVDLSEKIDFSHQVLHELAKHLKSKSICIQFGIHSLVKKALVHLPKMDQRQRSYDDDDDKNENTFRSLPLVELLAQTNEVVELLLADVKPTECRILKPFTDSYAYTMANLLAWHIFFEYFSASVSEERSMYIACLSDSTMLSCMLMNVIRLRPENPSACLCHILRKTSDDDDGDDDDESKVDIYDIPPMYSLGTPSSKHLQHVACCVYVSALKKIPVLVRTWWSNLDKNTAAIVEKFTSENISKILLLNEINGIHAHTDQFVNMTVDAYTSSREIVATYTLDDATIELSINIPHNYPLGPVEGFSKKKTIVDQYQWRTWMFQLTTFLNFHNGSIKDALLLWKKNLDKKFEGVEECMICYFILHGSSGTLPNKTCRICKKKFHGSCLFKWFKMSNSCSCPGCRNDF